MACVYLCVRLAWPLVDWAFWICCDESFLRVSATVCMFSLPAHRAVQWLVYCKEDNAACVLILWVCICLYVASSEVHGGSCCGPNISLLAG